MKLAAVLYVVLALGIGAVLALRRPPVEETTMDNWQVLANVKVPAKPAGGWTLAVEWVKGPGMLKFEAGAEEWFYAESDQNKAFADGDLAALVAPKTCLLPTAPVGALIGKIGGSSAGTADGTVFVVGKFCLLEVAKSKGPVYLTINDELTGLGNNRGEISVKISGRRMVTEEKAKEPEPDEAEDKPKPDK
jgi:hypothetical protein